MLCVAAVASADPVWAKANGFPGDSCGGCHRGENRFKPRITADPAKINPGESVTLTLFIPGAGAGFYLSSNQKGLFTVIPGEGVQRSHDTGVTHTSPKAAGGGGEVTFKVKWTAPNMGPGGVDFDLTALSTNNDGSSRGDTEGAVRFNFSFGCEGVDAYLDQDGDGWGLTDLRGPQRKCELLPGWTLKPGDCNDYDKNANPNGTEVCNLYDDDCDGMVNEGLEAVTVYRDEDGDGHGARFSIESKVGCGTGSGWSSLRDDCDDKERSIHPGIKETCNYKDDNCNGRVDEGARKYCGFGWCRREASSCEANAICTPNPPRAEMCNGFDDDCDDVVDNDAPCPEGNACYKGICIDKGQAAMMAANDPPPPPPRDAGPSGAGASSGSGYGGSTGEPLGSAGESGGNPTPQPTPAGEEPAQPKLGCSYGGRGETAFAAILVLAGLAALAGLRARRRRV